MEERVKALERRLAALTATVLLMGEKCHEAETRLRKLVFWLDRCRALGISPEAARSGKVPAVGQMP